MEDVIANFVPACASKNFAAVQCDVIMLVANGYQVGTQHICNCAKQQANDWSESKFASRDMRKFRIQSKGIHNLMFP